VVVEATGSPEAGTRHAYEALVNGSHVVMATVEADATVGPLLAEIADARDLVYTTAYGDQPALVAELVSWARTAGMDVVAAGRGISSYDANAAIELCAAANATGLPPDSGGLHVPTVPFADAPDRLRPEEDGGILADTGVVDGVVSPPEENRVPGESIADGVFVVVTTPNDDALEFFGIKNRSGAHVSAAGRRRRSRRPWRRGRPSGS
jgi:predicted homoserine dehydrogenase-like protein